MYDNDSYCDWGHRLLTVESAAAASEIAAGPAQGEVWRIVLASAYHDDPAAHDVYWQMRQGALTKPFETGGNLLTSYKYQLYDKVKAPVPIILRYGEYIVCTSTAPMAAGKKMYMNYWVEVLGGVTS